MTAECSLREKVVQLETEIAELTARLPKHSIPPALFLRLEELEDSLSELKLRLDDMSAPDSAR